MDKIAWAKSAVMAVIGAAAGGAWTGIQNGEITKQQILFNAIAGAGAVVIPYLMRSPKKQ